MLAARRIRKIDTADAASADGERDARGDWRPDKPIAVPPFIAWPPPLRATVKWVFGIPGYLWPTNCLWLGLSLVTWFFLTPDLAAMRSFELWWIALLLARNFALAFTGSTPAGRLVGLVRLADVPCTRHSRRALLLHAPPTSLAAALPVGPSRPPHQRRDRAVVGTCHAPGRAKVYFSTVVVSWLLAPHPLVALFQIQIAAFSPALRHSGFDTLLIGRRFSIASANYFHYLHHRYFECNYGGTVAPFDKLFGTFHDGSPAAHTAMRARMRARHSNTGS